MLSPRGIYNFVKRLSIQIQSICHHDDVEHLHITTIIIYMKDNAEKSHIFFFLLRGIWSIVKRTKISKSWFFFKRFWYSVYVRSQHVIIFCEITRYFILGVLKFLLPLYHFTVNVGFYAAVRMF